MATRQLAEFGSVVVHGERAMTGPARCDSVIQVGRQLPGSRRDPCGEGGLTLTVANQAVLYDRSFSLDDYLQAQDRIHRISQTQTCYVWNLR